ncbi:MAG: hypothetical protein J6U96_03670 [Elusimicrobiaceae bacterium]|nr:hypothetical protein [Elusimicrobiaceae bacterium]
MKKLIFSVCLLLAVMTLSACHKKEIKETPYNRNAQADTYERNFSRNIFVACVNPNTTYATYSLAHLDAKPTDCEPRYKVTFVNGPCKGKTVYSDDVILKTAPIDGGQLLKGDIVLRDFWNPRKLNPDTDKLDRWNIGVVYDTSRLQKDGVVELEFPRDRNDFMAPREFIYVQNIRYIEKPAQKPLRTWL